ncbi:TonB-dependent receptor [Lysobacter antibioticus]|uniref:TonB-dependent receptor n=1 Tax=Lysobacter antibioticus TaxID=84531 RepID=UPI000ACEB17E|nr:TonB-dependent receptor [Lysobacter antibioticus]
MRSVLSLALSASLFSGAVMAQSAIGSIFGHAAPEAVISIENVGTGAKRTVKAGGDGRFTFSQLPPGDYRVSTGSDKRDVHVPVGTGVNVSFVAKSTAAPGQATDLDGVVVNGSRINPIDVSSVESTTVISAKELLKLPVARELSSVALLAPSVVKGDAGYGNLVSVGGSSVAENGYYINGFDITNMRDMLSYFDMPFEAVSEIQVKTGGYGAEFGRSLGGVLSVVTKRGTNDWKGGASVYWEPRWLRERNPNLRQRDPHLAAVGNGDQETMPWFSYSNPANETESTKYNVYQSGPIIRDKLFFFALLQGRYDIDESYGYRDAAHTRNTSPQGVVKLDWNINDDHSLELTGVFAPRDVSRRDYRGIDADEDGYPDRPFGSGRDLEFFQKKETGGGGRMGLLKYTGRFGDDFILSAQAGRLDSIRDFDKQLPRGIECPGAYDSRGLNQGSVKYIGCWNPQYLTYVDGTVKQKDIRDGYRIDGEWHTDDHTVRFGVDYEKNSSNTLVGQYSGNNTYYRYLTADAGGRVLGVSGFTPGGEYVRLRSMETGAGGFSATNTAVYLEDNWQVTKNLLLYGGLRRETFDNKNMRGATFIKVDNQWSPRLGFSWDINGDSSFKVYGTAGRYFIPIPNMLAITLSNYTDFVASYHTYQGIDPATGAAVGLSAPLTVNTNGTVGSQFHTYNGPRPPDPRTITDTELEPMSQDEFILGAQWTLANDWTVGVRGIRRAVNNGFDNYCTYTPYVAWAEENGSSLTRADFMRTQSSCIFINPNKDATIGMHLDGDINGPLTNVTLPARYFNLPSYKRKYNAIELMLEKSTPTWSIQGSYTWAHSYGNVEGYANSTEVDGAVAHSIDFNNRSLQEGSYGDLANDRRHTLKVFGSYNLNEEWRLGGNLTVQSGLPRSCRGRLPTFDQDVHNGEVPSYYSAEDIIASHDGGWVTPSTNWCHDRPFQDSWTDTSGNVHQYTNYGVRLSQRGEMGRTPWWWNFDFQVAYIPNWADKKLTLQLDVYNLFNRHKALKQNEAFDRRISVEDDPNIPSPDPALNSGDYFELWGPNPNWGQTTNFQTPRYVQLSARYEW